MKKNGIWKLIKILPLKTKEISLKENVKNKCKSLSVNRLTKYRFVFVLASKLPTVWILNNKIKKKILRNIFKIY